MQSVRRGRKGEGRRRILAVLGVIATVAVGIGLPDPAVAQSAATLDEKNEQLRAENEQLRGELDALRKKAAGASAEATVAAEEAASGTAGDAAIAPSPRQSSSSTAVVPEYVPMNRVSLTVSTDEAGAVKVIGTPWYRTVPSTGLLPRREFIQFRGAPARGGRPEQIWMSLNRQGVPAPLGADTSGQLQIGAWTGEAVVVDQETSRRRRLGRQSAVPPRRDENTVFAFPAGALAKLALSDRASFDAGPVHFEFTDETIAAASALAARLAREQQSP